MRASFRISILAVAALALFALPAGADQACAQVQQIEAKLGGFSEGSLSRPLYWVAEADGQAVLTVLVPEISCDGSTSSVGFSFADKTTVTPDYVHQNSPPVSWANTAGHRPSYRTNVSITDDALSIPLDSAPAEYAVVTLTSQSNVVITEPKSAALIIVDDDGPTARIALVDGSYEENETSGISTPSGGVPVFRGGSASGSSTFHYTLSGGTATPGADFANPASGDLTFGPGERMKLIPIQIIDDSDMESSETVDVSISGDGVEDPKAATFTITDNEEGFPPTSQLHHPRQHWKYPASDYRIREVHIFTDDTGGSGVIASEFALRRNMKNKSCEWWTGKKFKKGKCDKQKWLKTGEYETDFYYIKVPELAPSLGKIKDYTAFSRATDGAHNTEETLEVGRNDNTFEVKKGK